MSRANGWQAPFSIAVLAGGESSRMGSNKALKMLSGKPVISHLLDSLKPLTNDIFIAAGDVAAYEDLGYPIRADQYGQKSSLVGIYSALAASNNDLCFTVACDMPFAEPALVLLMAGLVSGHDAVVPVSQRGREPLHAFYSRACLGRMRHRIENGELALHELLDSLDVRYVDMVEMATLCDPAMVFLNLNSVVDLEEASRMLPRMRKRREQAWFADAPPERPPVICFVGSKNSGKTTFLEKLLPALARRGVRTACIKHDVHGFTMDREGTDTWRLAQAGAKKVTISSPEAVASLEKVDEERILADLYASAASGVDLVIAEGFKNSAADRIEVDRERGAGCGQRPARDRDPGGLVCPEHELVAVISDRPDAARTIPVFDLEDVEAVVNLIMIRYALGDGSGRAGA
ncbi:MAG: molybdopterin-guanine dinucleotide biosynthesis protein B [Thermoleophilia bacterium]|nr:molybdopterin-guanine dinucleotide biosynthesis protein B [Thermoleophilia bacterium]